MTTVRTHVFVEFANPFLVCDACGGRATGYHDNEKCGCADPERGWWNRPCGHVASVTSVCPSWSPVDGCRCVEHLGAVDHALTAAAGIESGEPA